MTSAADVNQETQNGGHDRRGNPKYSYFNDRDFQIWAQMSRFLPKSQYLGPEVLISALAQANCLFLLVKDIGRHL